ncbi:MULTISPECIES: hypothetical protein [Enterococcus]
MFGILTAVKNDKKK